MRLSKVPEQRIETSGLKPSQYNIKFHFTLSPVLSEITDVIFINNDHFYLTTNRRKLEIPQQENKKERECMKEKCLAMGTYKYE